MVLFPTSWAAFAGTAVTAAAFSGCTASPSGSAPMTPAATASSGTPTTVVDPVRAYVQRANTLCDETMTAVRQIVPSGYSAAVPVAQYRLDAPKLRAVYDSFDQKLAAIPVPVAAQPAAAAFKTYVAASDQTKAAALAAAGSQATFAAEFTGQDTYWQNNPVMAARDAAGFSGNCNYR